MNGRTPEIRTSCSSCQFREKSVWSALTDSEINNLENAKVGKEYGVGEVVFHEGDDCRGVYCVRSGLIGIRKTDVDGNSVLLGRLGFAGTTLGYRPFLAGQPHRGTAEILKLSFVCFIDGGTVRRLLERNPTLGLKFLECAATALGDAEEDYFQSITHPLRMRLAHLLLVLKDRYGTTLEDGSLIMELPLSRQDMAAMIGARPETMSRTIRALAEDGVAEFSGRTVRVPQVQTLFNEIEPEIRI